MKPTNIKKRGNFSNPRRQSGYILIVSVILLGAMLMATLGFFQQSADSVQISGYDRDSAEALLLAESGMNMLYGTFIFGEDIDGDGNTDKDVSFNINNPDLLSYMFFVSAADDIKISATEPGILQRISNGQARSASHSAIMITNNRVPAGDGNLLISELFNGDSAPITYEQDNITHELKNNGDSWATLRTANKNAAVAWLELIRSTDDGPIEIYVQAAAQVGKSINYVQRYVGSYPNTLGQVTNLSESSP